MMFRFGASADPWYKTGQRTHIGTGYAPDRYPASARSVPHTQRHTDKTHSTAPGCRPEPPSPRAQKRTWMRCPIPSRSDTKMSSASTPG
eukprot:3530882-Rhodomonas_salina.3